ncbi:MAG: NAD(P)/FAD-dependent oxidoreductase, partial [Ruthenibacterium lactatiformans]
PEAPQEANFLHGIGCSVTYIAGRRPDTLEAGVAFRAGRVEAVEGGAAVEAVRVGGATLPVQGVFILRAATPPDALVPGLALENGFVKTDAAMRTNIPGLFAAGDMTGKPLQVANAVGDGLVAALAAVDYLDGVSPMTD